MSDKWRLIINNEATASDLLAIPAAIAEGKLAGRYILSSKASADTLIVQKIKKKGILIGADVLFDKDEADKNQVEIAVKPRSGRGGTKPAEMISLDELMLSSSDEFKSEFDDEEIPAALIYTSGTTGVPKGVILTHENFLAENRATESIIPTESSDKFSSLVPFFHVFGLADGCVVPLLRAAATVLVPQYAPRKYLEIIKEEKVTVILAIPDQYKHLLRAAIKNGGLQKLNIRYCISGAEKLSDEIIEGFSKKLNVEIIEGYGMTETTAAVTINPPKETRKGSVGKSCRGVDIRIVDDEGRELRALEIGEIIIRGDIVTPGYLNLSQETKKTIKDGWLYTGDIGYRDEDGYLFITDRKKDIIIKSGFNISPTEIEKIICKNSVIKDAAVISFIKNNGKQGIRLFCSMKGEAIISKSELYNFCKENLASYKVPDEIVFVEKIPKSLTGKILRKELRDGFLDQRLIKRGTI